MNKRKIAVLLVAVLVIAGVAVSFAAEPGSEGDPVVTLSYITDKVVPEIYAYIDSKISSVSSSSESTSGKVASDESTFAVAEVPAGNKVICGEGAEIILRAGSANVIATQKGGLADTTAGFDLPNGMGVPSNHLLIVPFNDGRGVETVTDCIFMIKGNYSIK